MTVQMNRGFDRRFHGFYNGIGIIGCYESRHIFETDAVCAHGLEIFGFIYIIINIVNLAAQTRLGQGIAYAPLEVLTTLLDYRNHRFKIAIVIQGIKKS